MSEEMSLEERKVIYRARRGLKEIDVYFDPYVKQYYLNADAAEKEGTLHFIGCHWLCLWFKSAATDLF